MREPHQKHEYTILMYHPWMKPYLLRHENVVSDEFPKRSVAVGAPLCLGQRGREVGQSLKDNGDGIGPKFP